MALWPCPIKDSNDGQQPSLRSAQWFKMPAESEIPLHVEACSHARIRAFHRGTFQPVRAGMECER